MFRINGIHWELYLIPSNDNRLIRSDGIYTLGVTDLKDKRIYINNQLKGRMLDKVLSHELVHCFCLSYGCTFDLDTEEIVADFLATYGRDVFDVADKILYQMIGQDDDFRYRFIT